MDTIFALATAQGRAGVAVVRISGPAARLTAGRLMRDVPEVRGLRRLTDQSGMVLDEALVLCFDVGASFTGEEVVELHLHGSVAVVAAVLRVLGEQPELRSAAPGEFTRRAMENGRLDLAQVEGLADLIDAETELQRKQALRALDGELGELAAAWRVKLVRATALLEAMIDFADEEVPEDTTAEVLALIDDVYAGLEREYVGVNVAERVRDGFEVAIVGRPNVGKSTLLNRITGRDAAITSDIAGTTRDVIELRYDLDGLPVTFLDTAGLHQSGDQVEQLGINLALERGQNADLRIHMLYDNDDTILDVVDGDILVAAKSDLIPRPGLLVSGKTGEGVEELLLAVRDELGGRVAQSGVAMRERHRLALRRAIDGLGLARGQLTGPDLMIDLAAEDLRSAGRAIDSLVGRIDVEQVLDEIFSSFCIGK